MAMAKNMKDTSKMVKCMEEPKRRKQAERDSVMAERDLEKTQYVVVACWRF